MIISEPARALLITGTVGSGKTATADALGGLLAEAGIPNAVVDLDWLRRSWPAPPGDPFHSVMTLRNLRDVARNYLAAGVSRLVLAGVVESRAERRRYEETIAAELTVCRLRVALPAVHRRLARRHEGDDAGLRWHVERSGELDRILDAAEVEDVVVEAADRPATAVAASVLDAVGWR